MVAFRKLAHVIEHRVQQLELRIVTRLFSLAHHLNQGVENRRE
jgi:hypothetical protein